MNSVIPIALFTYTRTVELRRTLASLQADSVPLIHAFSDGPRTPAAAASVADARAILREIDWCEIVLHERSENWGLGRSIMDGVAQMLAKYESIIVFEDDLICVPGTYRYLSEALNHYRDSSQVMSVTGWTHPRVTPNGITDMPYFDGRAECWVWGTWRRVWQGMDRTATRLVRACAQKGIDVYRYGAGLRGMADIELQENIWAVRLLYLHILHRGLCLRPPHSMVEHIGIESTRTTIQGDDVWSAPPLVACPPIPARWPEPSEHPDCSRLWQRADGCRPTLKWRLATGLAKPLTGFLRKVGCIQ